MEKTKSKSIIAFTLLSLMVLVMSFMAGCSGGAKIELSSKIQTDYFLNDNLNVTGGQITYTNEEGKVSIVDLDKNFVTGFDTSTYGQKEFTIVYEGVSTKVKYNVYNFVAGNYTEIAQKVINKKTGEVTYEDVTQDQSNLIINKDYTLSLSMHSTNNEYKYTLELDGGFEIFTKLGEEVSSGYYEDGYMYLNVQENEDVQRYSVFEIKA